MLNDAEFEAEFWKKLGPNYCPALEVYKSFPGNAKDIFKMLSSGIPEAELAKTLQSLLKLKESLSVIMASPGRVHSLRNLSRFLHSMATKPENHSMSKAERKERQRQKDLAWELWEMEQESSSPAGKEPVQAP